MDYVILGNHIIWVSAEFYFPYLQNWFPEFVVSEIIFVCVYIYMKPPYCDHHPAIISQKNRTKVNALKWIYSADEMDVNIIMTKPELITGL